MPDSRLYLFVYYYLLILCGVTDYQEGQTARVPMSLSAEPGNTALLVAMT